MRSMTQFQNWRRIIVGLLALALAIAAVLAASWAFAAQKGDGKKGKKPSIDKQAILASIRKDMPTHKYATQNSVSFTAADLDQLLDWQMKGRAGELAPVIDDEKFVRRIHLDVTGKLPRPSVVQEFVADANPRKRSQLIDQT